MGEGDAGTPRKTHQAASPARARGPQSCGSTGLRRGQNRSEHKAPRRPASGSLWASPYPPPVGGAVEPVPGGGKRGASRTPPGSQTPCASVEAMDASALLSATTPQPRRGPGRSFARLTYPAGGQFPRLLSPPAAHPPLRHPSQGLAAGRAQTLSRPQGPAASAAPEPATRP